jgi:two-component system NarL family sensor kinase
MADDHSDETQAEALQQRNRELSILNAIAQALNRSVDLDEALRATLAQVAELLGLHTGWIWLLHQATGQPYLAAAQNLPPALARNPRRMEGRCHCLDTYQSGDLSGAANINVVTCSRLSGLVNGTDGLRYHASIPLYAHGKELGVLNVASADWRELSPDDLRLLYTVGDLLGIAVERARLFDQSAQFGALEERNRLAREIHDTLAQGLTAVALQLESADAMLEAGQDGGRARQAVRRALALTQANLDEARRSVMDLRAAPLEGRSLAEALAALAETLEGQGPAVISVETAGAGRPLPARIEAGIYRIAQEALSNAVRHAEAGQVALQLSISPAEIRLTVEDDGKGFDLAKVPPNRFGLVGLNERARMLGGAFHLDSWPNAGTRIKVVVPL